MAYVPQTPNLGFPPIASHLVASSAAGRSTPWKLGDKIRAVDPTYGVGEFVYLKGVASTLLGSWVLIAPDDWSTTLAVANDKGNLAVAMAPTVANEYGWYQIYGKAVAKVLAAFADNGDCYLTSTAGSVDDADVAGDFIRGAKGASAIDGPGTGLAEIELFYPNVHDGADN